MLFLQARPRTLLLLIMFGVLLMIPAVGQDKPESATDKDAAAERNSEKLLVKKEAAKKTTTSAGPATVKRYKDISRAVT